ncbi:MAG: VCBS repeat-containing protein [Opitutae bacterium]|nr:VCBS repeat-containing protein [Opitutae bacterium]
MKSTLRLLGWSAFWAGCMLQSSALGQAGLARGKSTGEANPLQNRSQYTLFSHRELVAYFPATNTDLTRQWRQADGKLESWKTLKSDTQKNVFAIKKIVAAAGHITECAAEQVVRGYYREDKPAVSLLLEVTGNPSRELPAQAATCPELALAVGDVDGALDAQCNPHDEIVVAYPVEGKIRLLVLNQQLADVAALEVGPIVGGSAYGDVALALGDFDGDGIREIGLLYDGKFAVLRLDRSNPASPVLRQIESVAIYALPKSFKSVGSAGKLVAGDFNGDGKEEVAIGYCLRDRADSAPESDDLIRVGTYKLRLRVAVFSSDLKITLGAEQSVPQQLILGVGPAFDMAAGVFRYDPQNGFDLNRRQIAFFYYCSNDLKKLTQLAVNLFEVSQSNQVSKVAWFGQALDNITDESGAMAAGHFLEMKAAAPTMDLALTYRIDNPRSANLLILRCGEKYQLTAAAQIPMGTMTLDKAHYSPTVPLPIVAADLLGDSYYLGAPTRVFVPQMITTRYVMYEPPKHIDYLPDDPNNLDGNWSVVNVSRKDDLWVCFGQGAEKIQEVTTKDTTSFSFGSSTTYSAKEAFTFGPSLLKLGVKAEEKLKFEQNYKSATEKIDASYEKVSVSYQDTTNIDDVLGYEIKALDIWRYPCYGLKDGAKCGFYEIVVPTASPLQHSGGMDCADWYQPRHENGNVLSYPYCPKGTKFQPADLGAYKAGGVTVLKDVLARDSRQIDGNQGTVSLNWSEQSGSEKAKSYEAKLARSFDISIGATAKLKYEWLLASGGPTVSYSASDETSTGNNCVTKVTNESSKGVTLSFPSSMDNDKSYHADTAIFVTNDGTMKVAQAVDPTGSSLGALWWKKYYWTRPDPALNLPSKFLWRDQQWVMNTDATRKRMRGLILHHKNQSTNLDEILGTALTDGDRIELTARVYNYSLHQSTGEFRVKFERVTYDAETGKQGTERTLIGYANGVRLAPMEMKEVTVEWNTAGLGGATADVKKDYVIYVTVDPDGAVKDDLHPQFRNGKEFVGGNNEGYWPWAAGISVYGKTRTDAAQPSTTTAANADVSLTERSLALMYAGGPQADDGVRLAPGRAQRLRLQIMADQSYPGFQFVHFRDNGKVFATKLVMGVAKGSSYVWVDWTPASEGEHRLTAEVVENRDDAKPGNNQDGLRVTVANRMANENRKYIWTVKYKSIGDNGSTRSYSFSDYAETLEQAQKAAATAFIPESGRKIADRSISVRLAGENDSKDVIP